MHDLRGAALDRPRANRLTRRSETYHPTLIEVFQPERAPATQYSAGGSGSFFRACILLLLSERSAHGYDLLERLTEFGFDSGDSGWLYRTLRVFERDQAVDSTWQISSSGPPRRVYALTTAGRHLLDSWVVTVRASKRSIDGFLDRYGHTEALGLTSEEAVVGEER